MIGRDDLIAAAWWAPLVVLELIVRLYHLGAFLIGALLRS